MYGHCICSGFFRALLIPQLLSTHDRSAHRDRAPSQAPSTLTALAKRDFARHAPSHRDLFDESLSPQ